MMMIEKDLQTHALISYRQATLLAEAERARRIQAPSPIRITVGMMLIRLGERIRGCTQAAPGGTDTGHPASPRLHPVHQA